MLSSSDVTKRVFVSFSHWRRRTGIVDIDGLRDAPVRADKLALNCRQDRVGVQTFAERNKINFSRHWSRTGALNGTELLGNCCGQQIHGQYAYHRKWPIEPPQSPHSYPRAANLGATPHTQSRFRSATSDTHQPPRL